MWVFLLSTTKRFLHTVLPTNCRSRSVLLPVLILLFLSCACSNSQSDEAGKESYYAIAFQNNDTYLYKQPDKTADGWETEGIRHEDKAEELVNTMRADTLLGLSGVLVSQRGSLLLEEYKDGWMPDSLMPLHENELLLIATLAGVVQKEQASLMERPVKIPSGNYAVKKRTSSDTAVNIQHLLRMETGLLCRPQQQIIEPVDGEQPKRFYYCPANYEAIAQWLEVQTDEPLSYYAEERLFEPLEIDRYHWDDLEISMAARDMLKFSALHAQKGSWMQKQLLADDWVLNLQSKAYDPDAQGQFAWGWWQQRLVVEGRQFAVYYTKGRSYLLVFVPDLEAGVLLTGDLSQSAKAYFPLLQNQAIPALLKK